MVESMSIKIVVLEVFYRSDSVLFIFRSLSLKCIKANYMKEFNSKLKVSISITSMLSSMLILCCFFPLVFTQQIRDGKYGIFLSKSYLWYGETIPNYVILKV